MMSRSRRAIVRLFDCTVLSVSSRSYLREHEEKKRKKMGRRKQQRHQQHSDKKRAVRVTRYDMCMNGKDKGVSLPTILVLGDGDFSFSCALIKHRKCADGLTCTSIDSEDILHDKYQILHLQIYNSSNLWVQLCCMGSMQLVQRHCSKQCQNIYLLKQH